MRYEKTEEKNILMYPYRSSHNEEHIELFCEKLTDNIQFILSDFETLMLHKEKLDLDFNKIINLIAMTLAPDETLNEMINHYEQTSWKTYANWPPLTNIRRYLEMIQCFHQQNAKDILSNINSENLASFNGQDNNDELTTIFHTVTAEHVKDIVKKLREEKCLKSYANFLTTAELMERALNSAGTASTETQIFLKTVRSKVEKLCNNESSEINDTIKSIIETAKETFNYNESPKFYTFCIRIFDSILNFSDSLEESFQKHCADYGITEDPKALYDLVLTLRELIPTNNSSWLSVDFAKSFLQEEREKLVERIYNNMLPSDVSEETPSSSNDDRIAARRAWVADYIKAEDDSHEQATQTGSRKSQNY